MARTRKTTPSYLRHKASGKARAVWYDTAGVRQQQLLPGPFNSKESRQAFDRLVLEITSRALRSRNNKGGISVNELMLAYLTHAEEHYRGPEGNQTDEVRHVKTACHYVREAYGETPAAEFGPLSLKAVRQKFLTLAWCRKTINARIERIRRVWKWGVEEELVSVETYQALAVVAGLKAGRTTAPESKPVRPVSDAVVDATLPHLHRHVRGLVEFQRLTGCRPGEACRVRRSDLDMGGEVWLYTPPHHKTAWRGKSRTISIGPKGQALIREFITDNDGDYLFSPRRAVEELIAARAIHRKTPRWPSHMKRNEMKRKRKLQRKRPPAERYDRGSYEVAVDRACDRAFPAPDPLGQRSAESAREWKARLTPAQRIALKAWRKAHRWSPNQLRHSFATMVRKQHGLEAAQVALGHSRADITQVYAEKNQQLAAEVAASIG